MKKLHQILIEQANEDKTVLLRSVFVVDAIISHPGAPRWYEFRKLVKYLRFLHSVRLTALESFKKEIEGKPKIKANTGIA